MTLSSTVLPQVYKPTARFIAPKPNQTKRILSIWCVPANSLIFPKQKKILKIHIGHKNLCSQTHHIIIHPYTYSTQTLYYQIDVHIKYTCIKINHACVIIKYCDFTFKNPIKVKYYVFMYECILCVCVATRGVQIVTNIVMCSSSLQYTVIFYITIFSIKYKQKSTMDRSF